MRKLLWIGDAVVASGFAKATHATLDVLRETWDVSVLGLNYIGDPHPYPYNIFPCWPGGDGFGLKRVKKLCEALKPDVVVIQNDPWNIPEYLERVPEGVPIVASMPVDGKNCRGAALNPIALAIFWTKFGLDEARAGGYTGPAGIVPLGVDTTRFRPGPQGLARERLGFPPEALAGFVVGNVNRNQPRKRLDLTIRYFAEWVLEDKVEDAFLFLHVAPTGDMGYDVSQLMHYYGLKKRLLLAEPPIGPGVEEEDVAETYRTFDVQVSTTQGEGWGLTTMEGMACAVPQVVPNWAALGEWVEPGTAVKVNCRETIVTPNRINVVGGVPDRKLFINALRSLYTNPELRRTLGQRGRELVSRPQYAWRSVGEQFAVTLEEGLAPREQACSA